MSDPIQRLINETVVLDTEGPIVYIGRLVEISDHTFVLEEADLHDCRDGHANKEEYLVDVFLGEVSVNRRMVVVMRSVVISVSRLSDVVMD